MAQRQVSPERKGIYYLGMVLAIVGFLSFGSVFISGALHFGDFSNFQSRSRSMMLRAFGGMAVIVMGAILMHVGRMGAAGSGLKLDPEQARRDVEPWSRMTGGVVKDALDEAGVQLGNKESDDGLPFDERLRRLQALRDDGVINEQEYEATKKKILDSA